MSTTAVRISHRRQLVTPETLLCRRYSESVDVNVEIVIHADTRNSGCALTHSVELRARHAAYLCAVSEEADFVRPHNDREVVRCLSIRISGFHCGIRSPVHEFVNS